MTAFTPCRDELARAVAASARPPRSRLAALLVGLAALIDAAAERSARRQAARLTRAELDRLPREVLADLGLDRPDARPAERAARPWRQ
jgi:uncharacterized protein YjiS (DUF1127 family)